MIKSTYFKIADHILQVMTPLEITLLDYLPNFKDFEVSKSVGEETIVLRVKVLLESPPVKDKEVKLLTEQSPVWGDGFCFEESVDSYITSMVVGQSATRVVMESNKDFSYSTIYLNNVEDSKRSIISWFMMIAFGQSVLLFDTVLIHASVVEKNEEEAFAFLGKSGTGKSTHSQLWLKYLEGFTLLNDDNPATRIFDNRKVYIYGTPWSGKTHCYRSLKVELKGLVRLSQAVENKFSKQANKEALLMVLPSCTAIRWDMNLFNNMVNTIEAICRIIPVGYMRCKIDSEAAVVSFKGIKSIN